MIEKVIYILRGVFAITLYVMNAIFWCLALLFLFMIRLLLPFSSWRKQAYVVMNKLPDYWVGGNYFIMRITTNTHWEIDNLEQLNLRGWYLILPNHRSWADILVLGMVFNRKIPMLKFFMKKELIWLPLIGACCYALNFPFMGRYSKEYLKKHPEMKGKDTEATRKSCEKFKTLPTSIINFCEGTRFTKEKQQRQHSPYQHLLKPKAGGIAFTLSIMGEYLHQLLDVTLIYPQGQVTAWQFCSGQVKQIIVKVRLLPIHPDLVGDYENDPKFRQVFQKWLNELWKEKDALLDQYRENKSC